MLSKSKRLNLKTDFKSIITGKFIDSKYAKLYIKLGDNIFPKIGISVSSKIFKKAHERNRARRLVAEAFHNTYYQLPATINILALPKVSILGVKSGDVLLNLEEALINDKIIS